MFVYDLQCIDYQEAFALQCKAQTTVQTGHRDILFLLEHPPTVSLGRNHGTENLPESFRAEEHHSTIIQSTRGGDVTCHFPGQLVAYPIINLKKRSGGLRRFVHELEEAIISMLTSLGISSDRKPGFPGVWVGDRKIASLGLAVKHHVTMHGVSINVHRDLSLFNHISPCGLVGVKATSIQAERADAPRTVQEAKKLFLQAFCSVLYPQFKGTLPQILDRSHLCATLQP